MYKDTCKYCSYYINEYCNLYDCRVDPYDPECNYKEE